MLTASFLSISILALLLLHLGTGMDKKHLMAFIAWQLIAGTLACLHVFENRPNLFPFVILGTVIITMVMLKNVDRRNLKPRILLSIHVLRIVVELVLFQLYLQNKVPILMTFKGWNFDILIGFSALIILICQLKGNRSLNERFFTLWNIIGIVFLLFIVSLAILSSPLPIQQFAFEHPNVGLLEFPYCLLPTCVVPIVLMSHLLLINRQKLPPSNITGQKYEPLPY